MQIHFLMKKKIPYHNKVWFSDIAISMDSEESNDYISDKGLCYGQALLLAEVLTDPPLNLALIQCYRVYTWCRSHSTPI
ncbi:hypothetical protein GLOIN_2v1824038 [Rhizophagus irregularis DAOM 181602=DAOM 197198]|nr:hypothetical protein GLOIN_2v1824038 [Rhizophagus irregularis DAOM 181602=DAOM 197198]GBC16234.2 hypothetical protein GLOIN_2v1824038 [Rhizophagus irregularis DAOM 181602=DAOM 197198]